MLFYVVNVCAIYGKCVKLNQFFIFTNTNALKLIEFYAKQEDKQVKMNQNTSVPDEFDLVYESDPTKYDSITNMTFAEAMEIGLFNKRMMNGRNELTDYERSRICDMFRKKIIYQAGILYSMIYETDSNSVTFGKQLTLTPEQTKAAEEYKKKHESLVLKYTFSGGFTTTYNASGRFVKEYRLVNWRDSEGRVGWK